MTGDAARRAPGGNAAGEPDGAPPRVSVVTIFLDAERFLEDAIESVLAQTFTDWELLLVDDGSTDGSTAIARRYAARHAGRVRYLEHPGHANLGMSASRNRGVAEARGAYLAFLDADDVYLPGKLARQVDVLEARPAVDVVYGATEYWYGWDPTASRPDRIRARGVPAGTVVEPPSLLPLLVRDVARTPCTCGVVIRREAFERAGGFEESFPGMFEDQVFFFKLFAGARCYVDDACLDRYRQHDRSWTRVERRGGRWDPGWTPTPSRRAFLEWLAGFLRRPELRPLRLWRRIDRELWPYRHPWYRPLWWAGAPLRRVRDRLRRRIRRARSGPTSRPADPEVRA